MTKKTLAPSSEAPTYSAGVTAPAFGSAGFRGRDLDRLTAGAHVELGGVFGTAVPAARPVVDRIRVRSGKDDLRATRGYRVMPRAWDDALAEERAAAVQQRPTAVDVDELQFAGGVVIERGTAWVLGFGAGGKRVDLAFHDDMAEITRRADQFGAFLFFFSFRVRMGGRLGVQGRVGSARATEQRRCAPNPRHSKQTR